MNYSTKANSTNQKANTFLSLIIVLMGIFLNQSSIIFGVNFSFADVFCCIALLILIFKNRLLIPYAPVMFFFLVSISVILTAAFFVPINFSYTPELQNIIRDYIKLLAIFMYFVVGYSIASTRLIDQMLRKYSMFALFIAIIGAFFMIFNIKTFSWIIFYGGIRLKGLMNDPNYFSILQLSALIYFIRNKSTSVWVKGFSVLFIVISVLASGSKTGLITLFCYALFRLVEYLIKSKGKRDILMLQVSFVVLLLLIISIAFGLVQNLIQHMATIIPGFARMENIFTDFSAAVSEGGSARNAVWGRALKMIKLSPIVGIGIGTYSGVAERLFGTGSIAHNTYLQLFAEWGIPLASIFFCYIFHIIGRLKFSEKPNDKMNLILRDMIIIFLIGSFGISLNNARLFWSLLGAFLLNIHNNKDYFNKMKTLRGKGLLRRCN